MMAAPGNFGEWMQQIESLVDVIRFVALLV